MNQPINQKTPRAERPDKPLFFAMMGAFFLFFAVAPAYWAFYSYGNYNSSTAFVQESKEKSEQFLTPKEIEERKNRILSLSSQADRYQLEAILSSAGACGLFVIALLLFRKALKSRRVKPNYAPLDWRTIPLPAQRIEVQPTGYQNILLSSVVIFLGGLSLFVFIQTLRSQNSSAQEITVKGGFTLFVFVILFILWFLATRAKRRAVRSFDRDGITRGDGKHFAWSEFRGVVVQTTRNRFGKTYVWREEMAFADGEDAWIISQRIKNYAEVSAYVETLPRAVFTENV